MTEFLRVTLHDDIDPQDPRALAWWAELLRRKFCLAFYRPGASTPFMLARGEPDGMKFTYFQ